MNANEVYRYLDDKGWEGIRAVAESTGLSLEGMHALWDAYDTIYYSGWTRINKILDDLYDATKVLSIREEDVVLEVIAWIEENGEH